MRRAAPLLLRLAQAFGVLLVIVFVPAIAVGPDALTRVIGVVLAAFGVGLFLTARNVHRRVAPKPPPDPAERRQAAVDVDQPLVLHATGRFATPATLTLDEEGFLFAQGRKTIRRAWRDIELVTTAYIGNRYASTGYAVVGYRLREGDVRRSVRFVGAMRRISGVDDTVPGWWEFPPTELAELMERYRRRWSPS